MPDNVSLLNSLAATGFVVKTPPQDYDDSYSIQYAKRTHGYLVTNDKYRDFLEKSKDPKDKRWIKDHSISFTFKADEFLPNPDCKLFQRFPYEEYKHYPLDQI